MTWRYESNKQNNEEETQTAQEKTPEQIELGKQLLGVISRVPDLEEVKKLLEEGADVNAPHLYADYPTSPLYLAVDSGNTELIQLLIDKGANVNFEDYDCGEADCYGNPSSPLIKAVKAGNEKIAKLLLDNKANINMEAHSGDDLGMTALRAAVETNNKKMIDFLLKNGANDIFVALARPDLLPALLENGADINSENLYGETIISIAKKQGKEKLVKLFSDNGAKDSDIKKYPPERDGYFHAYNNIDKQLAVANKTKDTALAEKLIEYGAAVKHTDEDDEETNAAEQDRSGTGFSKEENLMWAAKEGHFEIVKLLLSQGVSVNAREGTTGDTVLMFAIDGGNAEMVKLLIDKGADVNAKSSVSVPSVGVHVDYTALSSAAATGKTEIVKLLLAAGADVNAKVKNASGNSALEAAMVNGHADIVELLRQAGAKE